MPAAGNPLQLVNVPDVGVPSTGVVSCMLVAAILDGNVVLILGTPAPEEIKTALLTAAIEPSTLAELAYIIVLIAFVNG